MKETVTYFSGTGPAQTSGTLQLAGERGKALGITHILVPTTTGATAVKALQELKDFQLVIVTHMTGFRKPGENELEPEHRRTIEQAGVPILTTAHALSGIDRGVRKTFDTVGFGAMIAGALRMFGQGVKVAVEITLMAADAGLIPADKSVIALGGKGRGVDTALVIKPAHTVNPFDLRVEELICKPR